MENNYMESSSFLDLNSDQIQAAIKIIERRAQGLEDEEGCLGFEFEAQEGGIWFHHDESLDPESLAAVVQEILDHLEIDDPFVFSWSYTCSKPRIDGFGGGACALKRGREPFWVDAHTSALYHF